jgi:hypothetical protein
MTTTILQIIKRADKYNSENSSVAYLQNMINKHYVKPQNYTIMMGDYPHYWIVTNREASILAKAGYEYAIL